MERNSDKLGAPRVTPEQWEQRRYEIAKDMLQAIYSDGVNELYVNEMVSEAVRMADELIVKLKGGEGC